MKLKGSCHCGAVQFTLDSDTPYPYQRCYCSICRKTQGGGGYAINIGGDAKSMKVRGEDAVAVYHAKLKRKGESRTHTSTAQRHFCRLCGSALWLFSPEWPDLIHPFASAIDTPLPIPPQHTARRPVSLACPAAACAAPSSCRTPIALFPGDVVVWGGKDRLRYHAVLPLKPAHHPATGEVRINITFRKAG